MTLTNQYIDAARNAWCNEEAMADESNIPPKKYGGLRDYVKAEQMVQLALAIPLGCVIGWFFGGLLDRHFHTSWIAIAGIVVGAAGGFLQIVTIAARYLKNNR
jgi:F0F1-type ATP synthase assembly protein I